MILFSNIIKTFFNLLSTFKDFFFAMAALGHHANENIVTNINFWKIIKPFLTNKGHLENGENNAHSGQKNNL